MNPLRLELATRRGELRARIAAQRDDLARLSWPVRNTLDLADQGAKGLHWLQDHPGTVSAAVAASVVLRPRRMFRWLRRGYFLWRGYQGLKRRLDLALHGAGQ